MRIRLIRHATLVVETGGTRLLVDPLLGPAGGQPAIPDTPNPRPNPLVDLPIPATDVVARVHAVLLTHLHPDHIDIDALRLLPPDMPILCQEHDVGMIRRQGFTDVRPVGEVAEVGGVHVTRTGGRHGTGAIGDEMGPVSGFSLGAAGEPGILVAGDTIWCDELAEAIATHAPDIVVVNVGEARFVAGDPITMGVEDVVAVCRAAPEALVIAVHMEAINHCLLGRDALRAGIEAAGLSTRVMIPADGETLEIALAPG
ncbi:MAG: MBL fold metallo-hydrolase [Actinobacteria bacterium]|nr:MBL fold metallo-hydrolase [Actinomycetota bacterium]